MVLCCQEFSFPVVLCLFIRRPPFVFLWRFLAASFVGREMNVTEVLGGITLEEVDEGVDSGGRLV